jgi:hypothetical protein
MKNMTQLGNDLLLSLCIVVFFGFTANDRLFRAKLEPRIAYIAERGTMPLPINVIVLNDPRKHEFDFSFFHLSEFFRGDWLERMLYGSLILPARTYYLLDFTPNSIKHLTFKLPYDLCNFVLRYDQRSQAVW